jgi:hypothetical protein
MAGNMRADSFSGLVLWGPRSLPPGCGTLAVSAKDIRGGTPGVRGDVATGSVVGPPQRAVVPSQLQTCGQTWEAVQSTEAVARPPDTFQRC